MKTRLLRRAGLALVVAHGVAGAQELDYPLTCSGAIDNELALVLAQLSPNGVNDLRIVLSAGNCSIQNLHQIDGAVSLSITGAGSGDTIVDVSGPGSYAFYVGTTTGGVDFKVGSLTFQNAQHGVIGIESSVLHVDQVRFLSNTGVFGGSIGATNASVTIKRSSFEGGSASTGGAIAAEGSNSVSLVVIDSTFSNNGSTGNGGAITSGVPLSLNRVLFNANHAVTNGGAVYIGQVNLTTANSTFTGNTATSGGAIATEGSVSSVSLALNNVTLHRDLASSSGSELFIAGTAAPSMSISNSLVGGSCAGLSLTPNAHGSIESPGSTCGFLAGSNQADVADSNLHLGALANNGGATSTLYPGAGSVMIDAASSGCEAVDQRGLVRNVAACDVGAVEAGATLPDEIFTDGFGM